jgi:hypothetical protein
MVGLKNRIVSDKKDNFIQRARVLLASKNLLMSDKTLEVLYWVLYYTYDYHKLDSSKEFKNMNQMHISIAKEMGVYSSYVGAYINDRLIAYNILGRTMSIPSDKFSRARIEKYNVPQWLESLYKSSDFKIDLSYSYE